MVSCKKFVTGLALSTLILAMVTVWSPPAYAVIPDVGTGNSGGGASAAMAECDLLGTACAAAAAIAFDGCVEAHAELSGAPDADIRICVSASTAAAAVGIRGFEAPLRTFAAGYAMIRGTDDTDRMNSLSCSEPDLGDFRVCAVQVSATLSDDECLTSRAGAHAATPIGHASAFAEGETASCDPPEMDVNIPDVCQVPFFTYNLEMCGGEDPDPCEGSSCDLPEYDLKVCTPMGVPVCGTVEPVCQLPWVNIFCPVQQSENQIVPFDELPAEDRKRVEEIARTAIISELDYDLSLWPQTDERRVLEEALTGALAEGLVDLDGYVILSR